jgi:hypothetical protein
MATTAQLQRIIATVKTGSRAEVKAAQKELEKLADSRSFHGQGKERRLFEIFLDEIAHFGEISDPDHQVAFINILKWPFLFLGDIHFAYFAVFIALAIQHPSGNVRRAVVHAANWLMMAAAMDLTFAPEEGWSTERRQRQEETIDIFCRFAHTIVHLIQEYDEPKFARYKYLEKMPASIFKSLHQLLADVVLRSPHYQELYENYIEQHGCRVLPPPFDDEEESPSITLTSRREELELEIVRLLEAANSDFTIEDVKQAIYEEEDQDDFTDVLAMFDTGTGAVELPEVLETVQDAWNYFPHKSIGGKSPVEKM